MVTCSLAVANQNKTKENVSDTVLQPFANSLNFIKEPYGYLFASSGKLKKKKC